MENCKLMEWVPLTVLIFMLFFSAMYGSEEDYRIEPQVIQEVQSLTERIRVAEFQGSARSQELISLKAKVLSLASDKKRTLTDTLHSSQEKSRVFLDEDILRLPNIFNFMPHLLESPDSLKPLLHVSQDRQGGKASDAVTVIFVGVKGGLVKMF